MHDIYIDTSMKDRRQLFLYITSFYPAVQLCKIVFPFDQVLFIFPFSFRSQDVLCFLQLIWINLIFLKFALIKCAFNVFVLHIFQSIYRYLTMIISV